MASPNESHSATVALAEPPVIPQHAPFQTVWETDCRGMNHYQSPSWYRYVGEGFGSSFGDDWLRFYHPDDRAYLQSEWQQSMASEGAHPYDIEVRIRRYDGVFRWFRVQGVPLKSRDGSIVKWTGTCTDIHDEKMAALAAQGAAQRRAGPGVSAAPAAGDERALLSRRRFGPGPLERRLFIIVLVGLLPLALLSFATLFQNAQRQKQQLLDAAENTMHAIVTAADAELSMSQAALDALAASPRLARSDVAGFADAARELLQRRPGWAEVILSDRAGRQLTSARLTAGPPLPSGLDAALTKKVIDDRRAVVGDVVFSPALKSYVFAVSVPVVQRDEVAYVLSAMVRPDAIREVLNNQRIPEQGVVGVFDRKHNVVARSLNQAEWIGRPAAPGLVELMRQEHDGGSAMTTSLEGLPVYSVFHRSAVSGWSAAIGIPRGSLDGPVFRAYALLFGSLLLSVVLGMFAAFLVGRTLTRPMRELEEAAVAVGQGLPPAMPATALPEIRQVALALAAAHADREKLFQSEREARLLAEQASKAKDEFLAMLGHELRNPLAAISIASEMLDLAGQGASKEAEARAREIIRRQVLHLGRLTDDLLDAGRVIIGKIKLNRKPIDLAATVQGVLDTMRNTGDLEQHEVTVTLHTAWVQADATRIDQVVANLLTNAVKYTAPPGTISVSVTREGSEAVLRVRDTGLGIEPDLLPRIFDLFVQGARSLDRAQGGLGIGLTLVRRLVELHGGSVEARSAGPGRGSEFIVRLPASDAVGTQDVHAAPRTAGGPRNIVLVEDNHDVRATLRSLLELAGHRVHEAADGPSGVETILHERADIAFIDIGLPGLDGFGVARTVRERDVHGVRLVALTGYGNQEDAQRAMQAGFDTYLVKPVAAAALNKIIAEG